MKSKLIVAALLISVIGFSQETTKERTWIVKLNLPQLIDFSSFPTVAIGVEKKINHYLSINTEVGYEFYEDPYAENDTSYFCDKGFKANLELRIYVVPLFSKNFTGKAKRIFVGAQGFYRWNQYDATQSYHTDEEAKGPLEFTDYFGVRKEALGVNFIVGYQYIRGRYAFEPFIGGGYMNRTIRNYNRVCDTKKYYPDQISTIADTYYAKLEEESGGAYSFTLGFRIGYTF